MYIAYVQPIVETHTHKRRHLHKHKILTDKRRVLNISRCETSMQTLLTSFTILRPLFFVLLEKQERHGRTPEKNNAIYFQTIK